MKRKLKVVAALAGVLVLTTAVYAAAAGGSAQDPLVTLSYLEQVFAPAMEGEVDAMVADAVARLELPEQGLGTTASVFHVVTLSKGQKLVGDVGCEAMLRVGTARCVTSESTGLIDVTDGSVLQNGKALVKNHLYMVTISVRSIEATADTTKLLVRGPYTVV